MVEDGILHEDEALELLDGELVIVSPQGPAHAAHLAELQQRLADAYRGAAVATHLRSQLPIEARPTDLPEPDLAVVRGNPRDYLDRHPVGRDALLVVEIARTSHDLDRRKASIYSRAGVPVYWLVDLVQHRLELHTQPADEAEYGRHEVLGAGEEVELPGLDLRWRVAELVA